MVSSASPCLLGQWGLLRVPFLPQLLLMYIRRAVLMPEVMSQPLNVIWIQSGDLCLRLPFPRCVQTLLALCSMQKYSSQGYLSNSLAENRTGGSKITPAFVEVERVVADICSIHKSMFCSSPETAKECKPQSVWFHSIEDPKDSNSNEANCFSLLWL